MTTEEEVVSASVVDLLALGRVASLCHESLIFFCRHLFQLPVSQERVAPYDQSLTLEVVQVHHSLQPLCLVLVLLVLNLHQEISISVKSPRMGSLDSGREVIRLVRASKGEPDHKDLQSREVHFHWEYQCLLDLWFRVSRNCSHWLMMR